MKVRATPDYVFLGCAAAVLGVGLIMLASASSVVGLEKFHDSFFFIKRQLFLGVLPGLVLFLIGLKVDYHRWRYLALPLVLGALFLLVAVFIPGLGENYGRAQSWLRVGPISFQPAEIAKIAFIIYLASWLTARREEGNHDFVTHFFPFLILLSTMAGLLIAQPDIGTMVIVVTTSVVMYFVAGGAWRYLGLLGLGGVGALYGLIRMAPYRLERLTVFLHPELDPQGIGYQINQAFLAIGSGGIWGRGLGLSRQKFLYLPEVISDSIFAVTAEELGFVFTVAVVVLITVLLVRCWYIALRAPDLVGKLMVSGIAALLAVQAFVNIGAIMGLLPLTGLPLPLVSYGGTAMAMTLGALGIAANVSKYAKS